MSELLPCPFCGGEAHVFHVGDWWVEHACKKLGKYIGTRFCETEEEAAAWWNTRQLPRAFDSVETAQRVAELEAELADAKAEIRRLETQGEYMCRQIAKAKEALR